MGLSNQTINRTVISRFNVDYKISQMVLILVIKTKVDISATFLMHVKATKSNARICETVGWHKMVGYLGHVLLLKSP
jgi:hypothetical protein